ncbi:MULTISPECIES: Lrp/AsnC ligand binding domain-containing protein [unclassified Natrinema]|uniref:Lrp/AsnC ligand binding domain-containing protein n=1 Tax=unclassified Natrinema TaxID=2622230 RepID=UPI00026D5066|nr:MULTISPECIES: Lrp/AsnC ligand binding domain-containing protein [unclassified Natrinema]AFO55311.1 AsnC family transcriptional regulator [Natrinema sp. J7-2]
MVDAYAMIDAATGTSAEVCETLRDAEGIAAAYVITGDFDVIVELTGDDPHDLLETVTTTIRPLEGVGTTRTYVCID